MIQLFIQKIERKKKKKGPLSQIINQGIFPDNDFQMLEASTTKTHVRHKMDEKFRDDKARFRLTPPT